MKLIAVTKYYKNCREHDDGVYCGIEFFNTIDDLLNWQLNNINDMGIIEFYTTEGKLLPKIKYDLNKHSCFGFSLLYNNIKYETKDDGKGNLILEK